MLEIVLASCTLRTSLFPLHVRTTRHAFGLFACASFPSSNTLTAYSCVSSTSAHPARLARIIFFGVRVFFVTPTLKKIAATMTRHSASRARAHKMWADRYASEGNALKAAAHYERAYGLLRFGADEECISRR